jgi:hypothetical protein
MKEGYFNGFQSDLFWTNQEIFQCLPNVCQLQNVYIINISKTCLVSITPQLREVKMSTLSRAYELPPQTYVVSV